MYQSFSLGTLEKCLLCVLVSVGNKQVDFIDQI